MSDTFNALDCLPEEISQSILKRTLVAEYLLCRGYLVSDLLPLSQNIRRHLLADALLYATRRMVEMGATDKFQWRTSLEISLN